MRARVVVAESYEPIQRVIRELLEPEYDIVAVVSDGQAALDAVNNHQPDLVVLAFGMPALNGIAAAKRLRELHPPVKIILVSDYPEQVYLEEAFHAGAVGYVLKSSLYRELRNAVERILSGGTYSPDCGNQQ